MDKMKAYLGWKIDYTAPPGEPDARRGILERVPVGTVERPADAVQPAAVYLNPPSNAPAGRCPRAVPLVLCRGVRNFTATGTGRS